jgi:hypothetical protein
LRRGRIKDITIDVRFSNRAAALECEISSAGQRLTLRSIDSLILRQLALDLITKANPNWLKKRTGSGKIRIDLVAHQAAVVEC